MYVHTGLTFVWISEGAVFWVEGEPYEYGSLDVRYVGMYVHTCEM